MLIRLIILCSILLLGVGCAVPEEGGNREFAYGGGYTSSGGGGGGGGGGFNTNPGCLSESDGDEDKEEDEGYDEEEDEGTPPPSTTPSGSTATPQPAGNPPSTNNPCNQPTANTPTTPTGSGSGCMTEKFWTDGNRGSSLMLPGSDCVGCHARTDAPRFTVAGTVFGAVDDVDNCYGVDGATVEVVDATGRKVLLNTNGAGNFYTNTRLTPPYTTKVTFQGRTREMLSSVSDFNCASCHTAGGLNGAPGRVFVP